MQQDLVAADVFCRHHQVEIGFLHTLRDYGLVELVSVDQTECIPVDSLRAVEKLLRFHYDLHINMEGMDVITRLLREMETMQQRLYFLQNRLRLYEDERDEQR